VKGNSQASDIIDEITIRQAQAAGTLTFTNPAELICH
jgi:hypothetical protein